MLHTPHLLTIVMLCIVLGKAILTFVPYHTPHLLTIVVLCIVLAITQTNIDAHIKSQIYKSKQAWLRDVALLH